MSDSALQNVHRLQRTDIAAGNRALLQFLREELELPFGIEAVDLRPSAVSLNSINGVLHTDTGRKFFKTHVEPASIVGEYYNAKLMQDAGYPLITPVFASTEWGRQFLIYEWFAAPSLFESVRAIETAAQNNARDVIQAAQASDDLLFRLYANSLSLIDADGHAKQPIHQLFLHRLAGPRFRKFYGGEFHLPGRSARFAEIAAKKWVINGTAYRDTLETIIARSIAALGFPEEARIAAVTGHGDAHAGNLFDFGPEKPLTYFDPAFAGTHSPLLDVIKPLIHNSILKWLYFPDEVADRNTISCCETRDTIAVDYDFLPSAIRIMLSDSRFDRVVAPTLKLLQANGALPANWRSIMQAASLCCPLLTLNLADRNRFTAEVALLGLAMTVELGGCGASTARPGWFEQKLEEVAPE